MKWGEKSEIPDQFEPRPRINEKGNIIPWYDYQPMKELDIIIQFSLLFVL